MDSVSRKNLNIPDYPRTSIEFVGGNLWIGGEGISVKEVCPFILGYL